jgi:uncharacterized membrane protein
VEISINGKQAIAIIWTLVAIVIALIVTLLMGFQAFGEFGSVFGAPWQWLVALFFGLILIITIPVYLLLVLWHVVSRSETT